MYEQLLANLAILLLSGFVGFSVISKVPNTLHTPLMSGTNAIHGIVVLGGLLLMHEAQGVLEPLSTCGVSNVAMIAIAIPTAAILLPRTAVRGPVKPLIP